MLDSKFKVIIMEPIIIVLIAAASFVLVAMMVFFAIKPKKAYEVNPSFDSEGNFQGKVAPWSPATATAEEYDPELLELYNALNSVEEADVAAAPVEAGQAATV